MCVFLWIVLGACRGGAAVPAPAPSVTALVVATPGLPADPVWARASAGGADALAALASLPIDELAAALANGGGAPRLACSALALHPDGELAIGRVAARLPALEESDRGACLGAIVELAARPPAGEPLDPDGLEQALRAVLKVARDSTAGEHRAAAATAAWLLSERRGAPAPELPADLY